MGNFLIVLFIINKNYNFKNAKVVNIFEINKIFLST